MKPWSAFVSAITLELPECPQFTMENALRRAAIEIYSDSRAWRMQAFALATTVVGQREYTVTGLPENAELVGLPAVWVNGEEVDELPAAEMDEFAPTATCASWRVAVVDGTTIRLVPGPKTAGQAITATIALAPTPAALGLPDGLYTRHHKAIERLAMADLMRQANKPWSNPGSSGDYRSMAERDVLRMSTDAGPQRRVPALRVRAV